MLTFAPFSPACPAVAARRLAGCEWDSIKGTSAMAAVCELCGKKPSFGMSVSHSHRRTKRRWDPNIQRVRALVDGSPRRLHVCTSCLKAGRVVKPPRRTVPAS
jgi:large subunit ribosomal protein L28